MKVLALLGAFLPTFHASDVIFGENGVVDISKTIDAALNGVNAVGRRLLVAHTLRTFHPIMILIRSYLLCSPSANNAAVKQIKR